MIAEADILAQHRFPFRVRLGLETGQVAADDMLRTLDGKRRRISISIPERDLVKLKTRAAEEGMPYQTLINSILHKYVEG